MKSRSFPQTVHNCYSPSVPGIPKETSSGNLSSRQRFFVSHCLPHYVMVFNKEGGFPSNIGSEGLVKDSSCIPAALIVVDALDNLILCDSFNGSEWFSSILSKIR